MGNITDCKIFVLSHGLRLASFCGAIITKPCLVSRRESQKQIQAWKLPGTCILISVYLYL